MRILRVLCTFERPESLLRILNVYTDIGQKIDTCILDSSAQAAPQETIELCKSQGWRYVHTPALNLFEKISDFLHCNYSELLQYDYVQLATDQDLFFISPNTFNSLVFEAFDLILASQLAWQHFQGKSEGSKQSAVLLRDQTSPFSTRDNSLTESRSWNDSLLKNQCVHPNTNLFWSLSTPRVALIRSELMLKLNDILSPADRKAIELYVNIFNAYASMKFESSSLVLRDADVKSSLRNTNSKESYAKKSFSACLSDIRKDNVLYKNTLLILEDSILQLTQANPNHPRNKTECNAAELDKLLTLTMLSYGTALSYDFNQRLYLYDYSPNSSLLYTRNHPLVGAASIYSHLSVRPLAFGSNLESNDFALQDPCSPLACENIVRLIKSLPLYYWTGNEN